MYIEPIFANTIWVSVPFLLSTLFVAHRWRWIWLLLCLVASFGIVLSTGDHSIRCAWLMSHLGIGIRNNPTWLIYGELCDFKVGCDGQLAAAQPFKDFSISMWGVDRGTWSGGTFASGEGPQSKSGAISHGGQLGQPSR